MGNLFHPHSLENLKHKFTSQFKLWILSDLGDRSEEKRFEAESFIVGGKSEAKGVAAGEGWSRSYLTRRIGYFDHNGFVPSRVSTKSDRLLASHLVNNLGN